MTFACGEQTICQNNHSIPNIYYDIRQQVLIWMCKS